MLGRRIFVLFLLILSLLAYGCSDDEADKNEVKDVSGDVIVTDTITDTVKIDAGKDALPDIEPDVLEDVVIEDASDAGIDVVEDVVSDVLEDGGTDVVEDIGPKENKYNEQEPNDLDNPNKVELNAEISGQIDEPVYDAENDYYINDLDFFEFDAKAGDIIRMEAKALEGMDIVPVVILIDKNTGGTFLYRAALMNIDNDKNAGMTVFIPKDGKYLAVVGEYTNFGKSPANVGGEKYKYILTIKYSTLSITDLDLSSTPAKVSETMPVDMPNVYKFNLTEEKYIKAETTAVRLNEPSDIDTVIMLFNADTNKFVEMADNIDAYNGITDSLLNAYTGGSGNFYLIVEALLYTKQKTDFELEVDFPPMDTEIEPNDTYEVASALRIPSETKGTIGTPKDGQDENGNPIKVGDVDNYYFYAKPGDLYRFSIIAEKDNPSSPLDAYLVVYQVVDTIFGPYPAAINLNNNSNGKDSMVEALISEEGKYFVFVMDSRNTSDNPDPVGGDDYKYTLKAEKSSIDARVASSMPYTDTGTLEPAGAYKFYKFSGVKGDKFTVNVSQANGSKPEFVPFVLFYDADTYKVLNGAAGDENDPLKKVTITHILTAPTNLMIAILDYNGEGGIDYKYDISINKVALPYYDETEPNDEINNANATKEAHSLYFGAVDGDGNEPEDLSDMYKFDGSVGQILSVALYGGGGEEVGDTVLYVLDSDGNVLVSNEDYGNSYYSAIYNWSIPFDGTFYIKVGPQTDYGPVKGSYVMEFELITGCLPSNLNAPQSGELIINEYYADYKDDVNGDGTTDAGDQFIEVVNPTDSDLLIELVELKVDNAVKIKFPCGTVIPAHTAIVIFGGGKSNGYFGGAQVFNTRNGLSLPAGTSTNAGIYILKDQVEITRVEYNTDDVMVGVSFTRDPDLTGNFVRHDQANGSNGAKYSPGTRIDTLPFVDGYAMYESEPNDDTNNANLLPLNESKIVVFGNLKYVEGAQDNDLNDYFKITLTQGKKISLITSAGIPPEVKIRHLCFIIQMVMKLPEMKILIGVITILKYWILRLQLMVIIL